MEVATGKFPYPVWNSVFDQLQQVVHGDPPILTPNERFSMDFVQFVHSWFVFTEVLTFFELLLSEPFFTSIAEILNLALLNAYFLSP